MRRLLPRLGLGTCVLGSALVLGCSQGTRTCPTCGSSSLTATPTMMSGISSDVSTASEVQARSSYHALPVGPTSRLTLSVPEVVVTTSAKPPADPPAPTPAAQVEKNEWRVFGTRAAREESLHRRSFTDVTVKPCFAHAPDYSWLVGEVEADQGSWRLHFASVDDPTGGSVTLLLADTGGLKDGRIVRVEGQLAGPRSATERPEYRVHSIRAADNP